MKISKTLCAALVSFLLVFQNFMPMVPVIAETAETNQTVLETDPVTGESVTSPDENGTTETTVAPTPTAAPKKKK